tara:strand:+ start:166 stop:1206 length:1041 start_codon:yes stop_codon:yes gene_type:complete
MVAQAIAKGLTAIAARGGKEAGEVVAKQADMSSGLRSVYEQPVYHSTKNIGKIIDVDEIRFVSKAPEADIGFHVGLSPLVSNQRIIPYASRQEDVISYEKFKDDPTYGKFFKDILDSKYEDQANLLLKLNEDINPARVPDVNNFKNPLNWAETIAVSKKDFPDKFDLELVTTPKTYGFDPLIVKHKGDELVVDSRYLQDIIERDGKVNKEYVEDLVKLVYDFKDKTLRKYPSTMREKGFNTQTSVKDRRTWFEELKKLNKKYGYDSFIYKNEYEGLDKRTSRLNPKTGELISIPSKKAEDSLMLMYPEQVKYTTASQFDPKSPKLSMKKGGSVIERNPYNYSPKVI